MDTIGWLFVLKRSLNKYLLNTSVYQILLGARPRRSISQAHMTPTCRTAEVWRGGQTFNTEPYTCFLNCGVCQKKSTVFQGCNNSGHNSLGGVGEFFLRKCI